ncbi:MAG: YicC family protein [bacterium]|nr:YicC family protein [bacterium]MCP5071365.1 YicC family protein [bacterium]
MIHSMTGFGRVDLEIDGLPIFVEVRSVNHRHLDVSVRVPRLFSVLEPALKKRLRSRFQRGKVDASVAFPQNASPRARLVLDVEVADQYRAFAAELAGGEAVQLPAVQLVALPGVARLVEQELNVEAAQTVLEEALDRAAEETLEMRLREGQALERELRGRLEAVLALVGSLEARSGDVVAAARERIRKRADQLREELGNLDEARLYQEVAIAADRLDVTEELVRLRSHVEQFGEVLATADSETPCGRRLDFLLQEMMREANTVGSKASDAPLAHFVVDMKTEVERIREQVQNVE